MNKIELYGRLTNDPEIRTTASGKNSVRFTVAVNRPLSPDAPKEAQKADFIPCTAFGKRGEVIAHYFKKGHRIVLDGELRINLYEKNGQRMSYTEVWVNNIDFVETKAEATAKTGGAATKTAENAPYNSPMDEEIPF